MNLFELFLPSRKAIMEGIDHPEDLIISQGSAGADRVLKDLASLEKDPATVTVKWDGFPAVVFGRDKAGNLVFVDKHMYEKVVAGKIEFTTIKDYDMSRDANRSSLWEHESVLRPALDKIVPNVKDQYWMGDLMWTGTPPTQEGYFVFKPNTVEYRVKIDDTPGRGDTLSDNIARSVGGIAVHTYINGLGSADSPLVGLKGLAENAGITFLVGEMKDKPQVAVDKNLIAQAQATINEHKTAVDEFYKQLTAMKAKTVVTNMGPFITRMLEENDIQNNIVPRFLEFLKERLTDSAAAKMLGDNKNGWLYQQDGGAPGLLGVWTMWATVVDVKLHIKQQIDTQQQGSEVIAVTDGINAHEGYVFGAGKDKLKLIDRLGFSRANFAKHKVPDEEIEQKSKMPLAAFCFGRMNPPTKGHELVMQKTLETGGENAFIFLSNSNNPDTDPLDPQTKAAFISKMYPNFAGHIVTDYVQGPIYAANWLYQKGFRNMAFVAGSDRLGKEKGSIEKLLTGWNSGPIRSTDPAGAREHVVMQYVSSGQRDPDAEGVTGYSGSKARAAAEANNEQQFQQYTGVGSDIVVNGKTLYQATRDGMGIKDEPAQQPAPAQQAVQKAQPKTQVTKKVPGQAPMKDKLNQPMESVLRDKEDLQAKRKALQDIQMNPNTGDDPELAKELIRRKHALEREAKSRGLAESIVHEVNSLGEDNFGTSIKRPARQGSRPARGHTPVKEVAKANTKTVRTGLAKREKRADPTMDAKKKSEQDAAWERLQAHMNKPENMAVLKRLSQEDISSTVQTVANKVGDTLANILPQDMRPFDNQTAAKFSKNVSKPVKESPIEMDPQNPNDPMVMPPGLNPGKLSYRKSRAASQLADLARMAAQANEADSPAMWDAIVKHFPELETNIRSIQHGMQELEARRRKGGVASKGITKV